MVHCDNDYLKLQEVAKSDDATNEYVVLSAIQRFGSIASFFVCFLCHDATTYPKGGSLTSQFWAAFLTLLFVLARKKGQWTNSYALKWTNFHLFYTTRGAWTSPDREKGPVCSVHCTSSLMQYVQEHLSCQPEIVVKCENGDSSKAHELASAKILAKEAWYERGVNANLG